MKSILKKMLLCCTCIFSLVLSAGCSCAKPMNLSFTVTTGQENKDNELTSKINVVATINKKFREPSDTPCYKKMEKGFVELTNTQEKYQCFDGKCFKKSGKDYVPITESLDISRCIEGSIKCYEEVANTYYKLLEDPKGVSKCYTEDGEYFERATYEAVEKVELSKKTVINTQGNIKSFNSEKLAVPSEKNYSLIYSFKITNNEETTIYIEALDFKTITNDKIKEDSYSKIKITQPEGMVFMNNRYYYKIDSGENIVLEIKIQNLLTSDSVDKSKDLDLNIPLIIK